ncbi:MAG: type II CAAX endopeptidase family protein [Terracidiphilus sp.]|jgi:membrane protease YdiL (CAAX protease family)
MTSPAQGLWFRLPLILRAVVSGILIALVAANVWPLLLHLGVPLAAISEAAFLTLYVWWAAGAGFPRSTQTARAESFRSGPLSRDQWFWGVIAAIFFAVTIHTAMVVLFRLVPFPTAEFRHGYDLSYIPTLPLRWLAVVVSAVSAGVCEETGFRGYMQRPLEIRYGATPAILISSFLFMSVHLTKSWSTVGMVPIVFGAGLMLGMLARSSQSLIPCIIGHTLMDIGLFAYWWSGTAGTFTALPIGQTGLDPAFFIACVALVASLALVLFSISRLSAIAKHPAAQAN